MDRSALYAENLGLIYGVASCPNKHQECFPMLEQKAKSSLWALLCVPAPFPLPKIKKEYLTWNSSPLSGVPDTTEVLLKEE